MTFERYWSLLSKQWKLILLCFLAVGLGTFIVSKLMTPLYQSTAVVQINIRSGGTTQADYTSLLASDQLVQTEAQLAVSDPVLREVASHYPGLTVEKLVTEVSSNPKANTQLFEIDVLDPNPQRAAALANDIATTLIKQQYQAIQQGNLQSKQQIQQELDQTQQQINTVSANISALQAKNASQSQISPMETQLNGLQQQYNQWQQALAQLDLSQAQNGNFLQIAQLAQPGLAPVRPNVLLYTGGGLIAGLLLGVFIALLYGQLDKRVRNPETLTELSGWPVLAMINHVRSKEENIINPTGRNINVEAYRILRTNIGFSGVDKPMRFLMVTSAFPQEGKSTIASNLAIFLAKAGKNTLLIDADMRRPSLHQKFNLSGDKIGLSNAILACGMPAAISSSNHSQFLGGAGSNRPLSGSGTVSIPLEPFMHSVGIPNLRIMPSGPMPPNPSELLDSKAMQRLFVALEQCGAEIVIFDTPPIVGLSDASILASKVDATVVVVDITRANRTILTQVKTLLTQASANVVGCVVNKERFSRHSSYSSYYYYSSSGDQGSEGHSQGSNAREMDTPVAVSNPKGAMKVAMSDGKKVDARENGR